MLRKDEELVQCRYKFLKKNVTEHQVSCAKSKKQAIEIYSEQQKRSSRRRQQQFFLKNNFAGTSR